MPTHKRTALLGSIFAGIILVASSVVPSAANAAPSASSNALKVSPVVTNLTINPGDTQTVKIYIQNLTPSTADFQITANDFVPSPNSEDGQPALLLNPGQYAPTHSLKRYISVVPDVVLRTKEEKAVTVQVSIPKGTSGGGYYGAIRFAPSSLNLNNNVTLSASVASLILVRVPGNFKELVNLASLDVQSGKDGSPSIIFTSSKNLYAVARFQNIGDVQDQPFGKIVLKQSNKQLASYEINTANPPGNVLPGSTRRFVTKLDHIGFIGKYTIYGNFGYGTNGQLVSGQTTFYVVPWPIILGVLLLIGVVVFFVFGFPKLKRQYDRNVVRRARR